MKNSLKTATLPSLASSLEAANEIRPDLGVGRNPAGVVCAANEERFTASHYSEPMTNYVIGWKDPADLQGVVDLLLGKPITTGRRFEVKSATNAEYFITDADDQRPIGATFKKVEYTGSTVNLATVNRGLTCRLDHDESLGDLGQRIQTTSSMLWQRLLRNKVIRAAGVVDAAAVSNAFNWAPTPPVSDAATSNPDADVLNQILAGELLSGVPANRVAYGMTAWMYRLSCYMAQQLGGYNRSALTPEMLKGFFNVDDCGIIRAVYQSSATAKTRVIGASVYIYYASDGTSIEDPSNFKQFISATEGGTPFRVYVQEHMKFTDVTVEHYDLSYAPNTLGVRKLAVTNNNVS